MRLMPIISLAIFWSFLPCAVSAQQNKGGIPSTKEKKAIQQLVENFGKAVKNRDANAFVKIVDIPYCDNLRKVIKTKDEFRKKFTKRFQEEVFRADQAKYFKVIKIASYKTINPKLSPQQKIIAQQVLMNNDWFVWVECPTGENIEDTWFVLMVGQRKGKLKIVGAD